MPEEQSNTTTQPSPHGETACQRSGALTGSGALEFHRARHGEPHGGCNDGYDGGRDRQALSRQVEGAADSSSAAQRTLGTAKR